MPISLSMDDFPNGILEMYRYTRTEDIEPYYYISNSLKTLLDNEVTSWVFDALKGLVVIDNYEEGIKFKLKNC